MPGVVIANQPGVYFVDVDGNVITAADGTTISTHEGLLIAGKDGTVMRFMRVAADGTLRIDPTGTTTQPISAASLPLPAGAATEATLAGVATETKLEAVRALLATIDADTSNIDVALSTRASETKLEAVRLLLASLDGKDYATQTTLAAILVDTGQIETLLGTIDADTSFLAAVDYATQATLAAILVDTGQIEALLTTIDADTSVLALVDYATATNQTDGSQKTQVVGNTGNIAGVNSSGQVAVQNPPNLNVPASTLATETTLASVLANQTNNTQKTVVRSGIKGTAVAADITSENIDANTEALDTNLAGWIGSTAPTVGQKPMAESIPTTLASDQPAIQVTVGVAASSGSITEFLTDDGLPTGSHDMVVNGSGTPEVFTFNADATLDIQLTGLRLVFSATSLDFDGASFGKGSELSNGIEIDIVADDGVFADRLAVLTLNEDFFRLLQFDISRAAADGVMAATLPFGGRVILVGGTSDKITVTINDNLTSGALGVSYLTATIYGVIEI